MMIRRLFLLLSAAAIARAEPASLTLADALASVEKVNVNVLVSRESVAQAMAVSGRSRADLLPNIALDAQQRRTKSVSVNSDTVTKSSPFNRFDGKLTGSLNILSPSQIAAYRASRRAVGVAEANYQQTLQSVLTSVAQTYFTHLRNIERIHVLDANIERARALLDQARRLLDAGVATQIDVTRAESQLAITEQARLQQDTTVYQSELLLKRLLDLDPATPLALAPFVVRRITQEGLAAGDEKAALDSRADYLSATRLLEQNKNELLSNRLQRLGTFSLTGEYGYVDTKIFGDNEKKAWLGGLRYTLPLFDGFRISSNQRESLARVRSQEYRVRNLELVISSEVRLANQDARSRFAQVSVAERGLHLAQDELALAQRRYGEGVADNREVVEAQNRLALASDNLVEAVYQYNLSRLDLARARGEVRSILGEKAE